MRVKPNKREEGSACARVETPKAWKLDFLWDFQKVEKSFFWVWDFGYCWVEFSCMLFLLSLFVCFGLRNFYLFCCMFVLNVFHEFRDCWNVHCILCLFKCVLTFYLKTNKLSILKYLSILEAFKHLHKYEVFKHFTFYKCLKRLMFWNVWFLFESFELFFEILICLFYSLKCSFCFILEN